MKYSNLILLILCMYSHTLLSQNPCVTAESFVVSPVTPGDVYNPGDIITICYTMEEFNELGANWFEGILIDYSAGFVANSITPSNISTPITVVNGLTDISCMSTGTWGFYNDVNPTVPNADTEITLFDGTEITNDGNLSYFPGFFFENGDVDNNPGNDFGDSGGGVGGCEWTFCFDLEVANCGNGPLNVNILPLSDGEIGGWQAGAGDCTGASTITLDAECNDCPVVINSSLSSDGSGSFNMDCNTLGEINLLIDGGLAPYTFSWSGPNGFTDNQSQNNTSYSLINISEAGLYTLTLGDASTNNCSVDYPFNLTQPDDLIVTTIENDPLCYAEQSGSIEYIVTGGVNPYSFSLNSNSPQSSNLFNNLGAGDYDMTIEDINGCEIYYNSTLNEPNPIDVSETISNVSCFGFSDGIISITASGGTPNYNYNWTSANPITGNGTGTISDLLTGNYSIEITDANNCPFTSSFFVGQNSPLTINNTKSNYNGFNIRCFDGDDGWISTVASGGMLPYTYIWTDMETGQIISSNQDLYNVGASQYQLSVTDAQNCPNIALFDMIEPDSISLDISNYGHKSCTYNNDGFIEIVTWGGPDNPVGSENFYPQNYNWKGPNSFFSYDKNIYNLSEGMYTIETEDINNCTNELTFEIKQNEAVIAGYRILDDTVTINYPIVNLFDNSTGEIDSWEWEFSNGFSYTSENVIGMDLTTDLSETGIMYYNLSHVVTDIYECSDTINGIIAIKDEHTLFVPNAFTPDFDGINDSFRIFHHAMKTQSFSISIFDRFGSVIFTSDDPNLEWDGKNQFTGSDIMSGVYSYSLSYIDFEGRIYDYTNCETCSGTISIIR